MPEARNWTHGKRLLRKPLIRRQKHCYNHPQVPAKSIQSVPKGTNQPKKRTPGRINLLTLFSLTYLVANISNNLLPTRARLVKGTRTTKEVFSTIENEDRIVAIILL